MALPQKNVKIEVDIDPPKVGTRFMEYGFDRIEQLMVATDRKTNYLPRTIRMEDIDDTMFEYINSGELDLVIDGKDVPTFYLDNDRWGEFSKTWKYMDSDKNVPTPYITVRRVDKGEGTRLGKKYRIAQGRTFRYLDVPILDEGQIINLRFKMPEPVNVDLTYEVSLFTKYRVDVNQYDEQVLRTFASRQGYIFIKGSPMPVHLESIDEANTIQNIDGDRYFVGKYQLKALAFLQDEKEFEITKTTRLPRFTFNVSNNSFESITAGYRKATISSKIISSRVSPSYLMRYQPPVDYQYGNIDGMVGNINVLKPNFLYFVKDASGDLNIKSGYAYYEFLGKNFNDIRDFRLISSENTLKTLTINTYTWSATENQTIYTIPNADENEIVLINNFLVGNQKQINNNTITTQNNTNDSITLDIGNDTITAGTVVYLEYFTYNT